MALVMVVLGVVAGALFVIGALVLRARDIATREYERVNREWRGAIARARESAPWRVEIKSGGGSDESVEVRAVRAYYDENYFEPQTVGQIVIGELDPLDFPDRKQFEDAFEELRFSADRQVLALEDVRGRYSLPSD
jgi:O-phosphoseryl-tRNA(Cys) synthetase